MATQPDDDHNDDDTLDLTDKLDDQAAQQGDDDDQSGDDDQQQGDDDKPTVSFDGEEPEPEGDNSVIRAIRNELRETKRKLAEAEKASAPKPVEIGEKPTLSGCEYDEDRYETELDAWKDRKSAAERQTQSQAEQSRKANEEWQADLAEFQTKKAGLQFEDRDEVIDTASLSLDVVQQAVIVKAAADPALFLYALGKSETKRAELAKIQDPIKLAAAVARMEGAVKVTRKAPAPDRAQRGSAAMPSGGADKELERLEKEAERNGNDRTKVIAYQRALKAAAADKK